VICWERRVGKELCLREALHRRGWKSVGGGRSEGGNRDGYEQGEPFVCGRWLDGLIRGEKAVKGVTAEGADAEEKNAIILVGR